MNIKETLISSGYLDAGVKLEDDTLNYVSDILSGIDADRKTIGSAFKFAVLKNKKPEVVPGQFNIADEGYYSNHFWKIYPNKM